MTTETKTNTTRERVNDDNRFEFNLTINDNLICQRFFAINYFKKKNMRLDNVKPLMDSLVGMNIDKYGRHGMIPTYLRDRSNDYLWGNYRYYDVQTPEQIDRRNVFENEDIIGFEIRFDDKLVAKSAFSGNYFPPKVRYNIDIRGMIPQILHEIRKSFSQ